MQRNVEKRLQLGGSPGRAALEFSTNNDPSCALTLTLRAQPASRRSQMNKRERGQDGNENALTGLHRWRRCLTIAHRGFAEGLVRTHESINGTSSSLVMVDHHERELYYWRGHILAAPSTRLFWRRYRLLLTLDQVDIGIQHRMTFVG